jgi:U3 small nucleolar ribonucleoprotein protein IMP4
LYKEEEELKKELALDDKNTIIPRSHIDDEYNKEFYKDPLILLTTSRSPSSRLTQFLKEMAMVFPNSLRINRGHYHIKDLIEMAQKKTFSDIVILHEHRGEPDGIIISHMPFGPTLYLGLSNVVLRHDLKSKMSPVSLAYPHLIFEGFTTPLGERVTQILKHLFPIPKADSKRVITFANKDDIISFRY